MNNFKLNDYKIVFIIFYIIIQPQSMSTFRFLIGHLLFYFSCHFTAFMATLKILNNFFFYYHYVGLQGFTDGINEREKGFVLSM